MRLLKRTLSLLVCALALSACAHDSLVRNPPPAKPQVPASVMTPRQADFASKMRNFLFPSPSEPTRTPGSSISVKPR